MQDKSQDPKRSRKRVPKQELQRKERKFKSGLEKRFAEQMLQKNVGALYEADRFKFIKPSHYVPDFKITDGVYVETKGYFSPSNRSNLLCFREQYPDIDIRMVFQNSRNRLNTHSKTTYANWCDSHGFKWWDIRDGLPIHWWEELKNKKKES